MSGVKLQLAFPQRHRPRLTAPTIKRSKNVAIFLLVAALLQFTAVCRANRNALTAKYSPTTYTSISTEQSKDIAGDQWQWHSDKVSGDAFPEYSRHIVLENRHKWETLGFGFEGDAFRYESLVIKVYREANAPFRNCVPRTRLRWPTEISASLVLGKSSDQLKVDQNASSLPVIDYFLAPGEDKGSLVWHMVTPYLPSGHLRDLAKRLRKSKVQYTAQELDIVFRSSFENVVRALDNMHTGHGLCHDDVKQDNIFLADQDAKPNETTHWLLAGLGNVREIDHPYHQSSIWARSNLRDCRANDVFLLVKAYMKFLSGAVSKDADFNEQFLSGETAWSRLFWATWHDVQQKKPISASRLLARSQSLDFVPGSPSRPSSFGAWPVELQDPVYWSLMGREQTLERAVKANLFYGATEIPARFWGLTSILGIPVPECQV